MNAYDDDALDRALFALPLEEPPAGMRAAILASALYTPAPAFSPWEIAGLGAGLAVMVWLAITVISGGNVLFLQSAGNAVVDLSRSLTSYATLSWLAVGGAVAIWMQFFTGTSSFAPVTRKAPTRPNR